MTNLYVARCQMVRETPGTEVLDRIGKKVVNGPDAIASLMATLTDEAPSERFVVFHLNTRHRVIGYEVVTMGVLDASLIHARDVFRSAIVSNASAIIIAHNHPSGDASPSPEDRMVTRQLAEAGRILGIPLLDHIVTGSGTGEWVSLASEL